MEENDPNQESLSSSTSAEVPPERRADAPAPLAAPKRIIVFSDGTGNSSHSAFPTNVYRLYQALDLGSRSSGPNQIAYYDDGVGTASFRWLALLGGILGLGLKRNLLDLYEYICRNYNDRYEGFDRGDAIFAFGFSRGAFTTRLLTGLICSQGIVPYEDERELKRNCADALRRFLGENAPDNFPWLFQSIRWARDRLIQGWRQLRGQDFNRTASAWPEIEFVGVWDTVAAYGGPIVEITRGIDQYVWPLTMTNYELHPKVKVARHALALDDERDSFWPLLWDEIAEERGARGKKTNYDWTDEQRRRAANGRLKQVWFAGMHSDVGGGYPDDSLAYVSLKWMLEELDGKLVLIPSEEKRIKDFANPLGPLHDSRSGFGVYYRYQPRKIAGMLHRSVADTVGMNQTRVLRDPTIGEKGHRPQGLLAACHVHRSVIERISVGADNYAPIVLPRKIIVEPPFAVNSRTPLANATRKLETDREQAKARGEIQENAWDFVWWRRICYFGIILLTFVLLTAPLWTSGAAASAREDSRWVIDDLFAWVSFLVPGIAKPWFDAWSANTLVTLLILGAIYFLANWMGGLEADMRDRVRIAWWDAVSGHQLEKPEPTALRSFRNGIGYQAPLQFLKWRILPFVCGIAMLLAVPYLALIVWTQVSLVGVERQSVFCEDPKKDATPTQLVEEKSEQLPFAADQPCAAFMATKQLNASVAQGERYYVVIDWNGGVSPWTDGGHAVPVAGKKSFEFAFPTSVPMTLGVPLRRVVLADWLEPLIEIREVTPSPSISGFGRKIKIEQLEKLNPTTNAKHIAGQGNHRWIGSFTAPIDGTAWIFLNDAALPASFGAPEYFYVAPGKANKGAASITLWNATRLDELAAECKTDKWNAAALARCEKKPTAIAPIQLSSPSIAPPTVGAGAAPLRRGRP